MRKSPAVLSYEKVGDQLRRARYLILSAFKPRLAARELGTCHETLAELGFDFALADDWQDVRPPSDGETQTVFALDDAGVSDLQPLPARAVGRRMFVNVTPIITPEEMARAGRRQMR